MSCLTADCPGFEPPGARLQQVLCAITAPLRAFLTRRRETRSFLDFTMIDRHTLDDMGLARIRFGAAPVNDDQPRDVA